MDGTKKIGIIAGVVVLALITIMVIVYSNLSSIAQGVVEEQVPNLTFSDLDVGWNGIELTGVKYISAAGKVLLESKSIKVKPSLSSIFGDTFKISSVYIGEPYVYIEIKGDGEVVLPIPQPTAPEVGDTVQAEAAQADEGEDEAFALYIGKVEIDNGHGDFVDKSMGRPYAKFKIKDVNIKIGDISVPSVSTEMPIEVSMKLEGPREGSLELSGWYDQVTDSGDLEMELKDIFLPHAEPYYRSRSTTARLSDGTLNIDMKLKMRDKNFNANIKTTLGNIKFSNTSGKFMGAPAGSVKKYTEDNKLPGFTCEVQGNMDRIDQVRQSCLKQTTEQFIKSVGITELKGRLEKELGKSLNLGGDDGDEGDKGGEGKGGLEGQLKGLFRRK
ncbi:MAG TPA: DUF748 domain-containing protein [Acidiferrobacteraceae bacterium]|nr:DUF748 domain-containing protein [Acidiferrobacteraceae bacterium]